MTSATPLLWHGSPNRFGRFERKADRTRLDAYWTAADPAVAAVYAQPDGWVQGIALPEGIRMLDATGGRDGRPLHYLNERERDAVMAELLPIAWRNPDDGMEPGDALRFFDNAIREGMCWEGLLEEGIPGAALNAALRRLGYQAVLCFDSTEGIAMDIHQRQVTAVVDPIIASLPQSLSDRKQQALFWKTIKQPEWAPLRLARDVMASIETEADMVPVVAFLDAKDIVIEGRPTPSHVVATGYMTGSPLRATSLDELCQRCQLSPDLQGPRR